MFENPKTKIFLIPINNFGVNVQKLKNVENCFNKVYETINNVIF